MMVAILNEKQVAALSGNTFDGIRFFNPILDADGNYVITQLEINATTDPIFQWVQLLDLTEFKTPDYGTHNS